MATAPTAEDIANVRYGKSGPDFVLPDSAFFGASAVPGSPAVSPDFLASSANPGPQNSPPVTVSQQASATAAAQRTTATNTPASNTTAILSVRGTFYRVELADQVSPGMYAVEGLNRPSAQDVAILSRPSPGSTFALNAAKKGSTLAGPPVLVLSISIDQSDITSQIACLNNFKVIYSFGQNFGQVTIAGIVLLGPMGVSHKEGVKKITDFFWANRMSRKLSPIKISIADNAYLAYLTGMKLGDIDAEFHVMPFVLFGILLDLEHEDLTLINPENVILTMGNIGSSSIAQGLANRKSPLVIPNSGPAPALSGANSDTPQSTTVFADKKSSQDPASLPNAGPQNDPDAIIKQRGINGEPLSPDELQYQKVSSQLAAQQVFSNTGTNMVMTSEVQRQVDSFNGPQPNPNGVYQPDLAMQKAQLGTAVVNNQNDGIRPEFLGPPASLAPSSLPNEPRVSTRHLRTDFLENPHDSQDD